jgi:hypothetical protein
MKMTDPTRGGTKALQSSIRAKEAYHKIENSAKEARAKIIIPNQNTQIFSPSNTVNQLSYDFCFI